MMKLFNQLDQLAEDSTNAEIVAECKKELDTFIGENVSTMSFSKIEKGMYNKLLSDFGSAILSEHVLTIELLTLLRLLSRDKRLVNGMSDIELSMRLFSNLYEKECTDSPNIFNSKVEILKCLCNWVWHSNAVRQYIVKNNVMETMVKQIRTSEVNDQDFYQIRLVFLISALEPIERSKMLHYGALSILVSVMEEFLNKSKTSAVTSEMERYLTEILKALFNITFELPNDISDSICNDCKRLANLARSTICTLYPFDHENPNEIFTHIANILLNLPKDAIALLVPEVVDDNGNDVKMKFLNSKHAKIYQGYDMSVVLVLLDALEHRIEINDYTLMKEKTLTVLTTFSYICRINPMMRKYLKAEVLPRLRTSSTRPEEQLGLRGKIITLLQTVDIPLKNMAADFLFVLCKENTTRLIKIAGYGNSAGFLASRGLMIPGIPYTIDGDYSSDEDSGDEGDLDLDVMTGATVIPKEDVFANLTESEKELEIDNLMTMTNRLAQLNVVKPMAVKSDGKIVPMEDLENELDNDSD